jgi:hypothetical protein
MPNTQRWLAWLALQRASDAVLVQLATMAVASVLVWESLRQFPPAWRGRARSVYLSGLFILFVYFMGGTMTTATYTLAFFVIMFVVGGAVSVWQVRHKAQHDPAAPPAEPSQAAAPEQPEE